LGFSGTCERVFVGLGSKAAVGSPVDVAETSGGATMHNGLFFRKGILAGFLGVILVGLAAAQSDRGSIAGSILDSTGAAITGASVTLTGEATGSVYKTVSSSTGGYRVNDLAIGRYDVAVEATGFKKSVQKGVEIQINTVASLNITLQPGNVQEEVTVLADAPTVQTDSSDIGTVVEDKQIHDLPLSLNATGQSFVRSPETFIFLTPGTIGQGTNSDHPAAGVYESKISGGQNFGSEVLLDGASVQRSDSGTAFDQTAPSVEALTEFKVTTSTPSAEFGHTSGGVESFTTKSGTNHYHGSGFELWRNEILDAQPWGNDYANSLANYQNDQINAWNGNPANAGNQGALVALIRKPRDRQNDFGGSLGGPVDIPHIYNGHDKTFFFFAWEQYRNWAGLTNSLETLPSPAELGGDFSALVGPGLLDSSGNPVINPCNGQQVLQGQIFNPATTQTVMVGGVAETCRLPFPGNVLTPSSTVAQNVLKYVPGADRGGAGVGGMINDYLNPAAMQHILTTQTTFRIDENVTQKNKLFFSYSSREQNYLNGAYQDLPGPIGDDYLNYYFTHYLRFGWDYIISPTVLNHLTVGFNRVYTAAKGPSVNGTDWPQALGISNASGPVFPQFQFNGGQYGINYSEWDAGNSDTIQVPNALIVADSVSWTKGRHSFKFGVDWRSYQYSAEAAAASSPTYIFYNYQTSFAPPSQNPSTVSTGDPFASFLLGLPNQQSLTVYSHFPRWQQNYFASFVQDDFKARKDLTLNLGLRWDIETPRHEATGAQSVLSLTAPNPLTPGQPGATIFGKGATGATTYFKDIGPRIGFAYAPGKWANTVIRGAYSIYYAPLTYSDFGYDLTNGTSVNPNFISTDNFSTIQSLDAGFPAYTPPPNLSASLNTFTYNGQYYVAPNWGKAGMVQNWDIEVQHQITSDLILSAGYIGQHATRLRSNLAEINTPNPAYNYLGAALGYQVDGSDGNNGPAILSSLGITVPSWFTPGWGSGTSNNVIGQLLRPYPQFGPITSNCCLENLGQSTYNAFQTKLERRFRNGLNLLASYTYSKTFTDADSSFSTETGFNSNVFGAQNPYNLNGEKALSYQDVPHAFVVSYMYELPAGHGKRYFNHGVGSEVLGGWQISGVQRYQSGAPTVINEYATPNPYSTGNYRYSLIPGQTPFGTGKWTTANQVNANGGLLLTGVSPNPLGSQYPGTPQFTGGWNSGCAEGKVGAGLFSPNGPTLGPGNCGAYLDPSAATALPSGAIGQYVFGDIPEVVGWWRSPAYKNEDFSVIKRTVIHEGQDIVFKLDIPNAFNRHTFGAIDGTLTDSNFGVPGGLGNHAVINASRSIQVTLRYEF
jgi:hypothetical protein